MFGIFVIERLVKNMTDKITIRKTARELVIEQVSAAATKAHERNYEKLHINRDGSINWSECINKSDDVIDRYADHFSAVPSVITVGTGSFGCNCDYCDEVYNADVEASCLWIEGKYDRDNKYDSYADAIADAVSNSDLSDLESSMLASFDSIEIGYFDDEAPRD